MIKIYKISRERPDFHKLLNMFNDKKTGHGTAFFHDDQCRFCTEFKPKWTQMLNEFKKNDSPLVKMPHNSECPKNFWEINSDVLPEVSKELTRNLRGFPTVNYNHIDHKEIVPFEQERNLENYRKFANL